MCVDKGVSLRLTQRRLLLVAGLLMHSFFAGCCRPCLVGWNVGVPGWHATNTKISLETSVNAAVARAGDYNFSHATLSPWGLLRGTASSNSTEAEEPPPSCCARSGRKQTLLLQMPAAAAASDLVDVIGVAEECLDSCLFNCALCTRQWRSDDSIF